MRLTDEQIKQDDNKYHTRNVVKELKYCSNYFRDRRDITNLDIRFYMWLLRHSLELIENNTGTEKRGRWNEWVDERWGGTYYSCSECGSEAIVSRGKVQLTEFCPYCGAHMEKENGLSCEQG